MSTFGNMFGNNSDSYSAGDGLFNKITHDNLSLVEVNCALTDWCHTPVIRHITTGGSSVLMDEFAVKVRNGMATRADINELAPLMGTMNADPFTTASIRNGYKEYNKGIMRLTFKIEDGDVIQERYISVLGYVTHNDLDDQLSTNAIFTPTFSWESMKRQNSQFGLSGSSFMEKIGVKTDYILNDGSIPNTVGISTVRPVDVVNSTQGVINTQQIQESGLLDGQLKGGLFDVSNSFVGLNGAVAATGVGTSKRANFNPTKYARDMLDAAKMYGDHISSCGDTSSTSLRNSESQILDEISMKLGASETAISSDLFLLAIKNGIGSTSLRGWQGISVEELVSIFPNFENCIPENGFVMLDRNRFETIDWSEITQAFGSSGFIEVVAQELVFNILDLLVGNGLGRICIDGSNCDEVANVEDRLSNINLVPYDGASLSDNDFDLSGKMLDLCDGLKTQIFNRLNTSCANGVSPVRFTIKSRLFGMTELVISSPMTNDNTEVVYTFPTFAPSPFSPIMGDTESVSAHGTNTYENLKRYMESL